MTIIICLPIKLLNIRIYYVTVWAQSVIMMETFSLTEQCWQEMYNSIIINIFKMLKKKKTVFTNTHAMGKATG